MFAIFSTINYLTNRRKHCYILSCEWSGRYAVLYLVPLVGGGQLPVMRFVALLIEVHVRELGSVGGMLHRKAAVDATAALSVHQSEALCISGCEHGGNLGINDWIIITLGYLNNNKHKTHNDRISFNRSRLLWLAYVTDNPSNKRLCTLILDSH